MSLRLRLVLTVVGLLVLGMGTAVGATFGALQDYQGEHDDDALSLIGREIGGHLVASPTSDRRLSTSVAKDDVTRMWRTMAEHGDIPSFFQIRGADGRVAQTVSFGAVPQLPDPLPAALWPEPATAENPDGEVFGNADTARASGSDAAANWRIRSAWLMTEDDSARRMLIVGTQTAESDELIERTARVAIISTAAALLGVTLLSLRAIRRGMRPLFEIADTADAVGRGDLTRRVQRSESRTEIGRLGMALNAMFGQIESAFRERNASEERLRQFVADASHELRTPIASIRGYAELFRRGAATRPDDLATAMARIESEATRMGSLVDELLLLARLDQGRPLEQNPVDLTELAREALTDASARNPRRSLRLEADGSVIVDGDRERLRQVLDNLLSNVVQHTPEGTTATLRVRSEDNHALIEVADNGPGLTPEQCQQVFERFFRVDRSRSRERGGAGLGLSIVSAVAAAHGGAAEVTSEHGSGATFRVRLPRGGTAESLSSDPPE